MSDSSVSDSESSRNSSASEDSDNEEVSSENSSAEECDPVPKPIKGTAEFTDICFHPEISTNLLAVDIHGYLRLYECESDEKGVEKLKVRITSKPCRCSAFSSDGEDVFVMTKDKIFQQICAKSGKTKRKIHSVHESSPYSLAVIGKNVIATGDEDGVIKLWDLRRGKKAIMEEEAFHDYISDIAVDDRHRLMFAVSGDGTMNSYNVRQRKLIVKSKREKTDLLSAQVMKNNNKLVVGSSSGYTLLYNWEEFALASDRFPGHTGTVESIAKVSEDIICTGSSDGRIRAVRILPNRFLGVVGKHRGFPIEKVRASPDGDWLASISHDSTIRFWAVDYLHRVNINLKKKADCSRRYRRLRRDGLVNTKADFVADIEKDMEVPVCDVDSDDMTSEEEQESGE